MNIAEILFLLPYLASLGLSLGALVYAWSRHSTQGTGAYVWYAGAQSLWIFGFILEVLPWGLQGKIFWHGIQWLAELITIVAFPVFAVQFTEYRIHNARLLFRLSLIIPILFALLLATDSLHHLIYFNPHTQVESFFIEFEYDETPVLYAISVYRYLTAFAGLAILSQRFRRSHKLFRVQIAVIEIGFLIPIIGSFLRLANIHFPLQIDIHPFTVALGSLIMAWGLYRFRIFDIVPIGRDKVFEDMVDPVVILGNENLVIDINRSMLALLGMEPVDVIGQSAKKIFSDFPIPIKMYTDVSYARTEAKFEVGGKMVFYELSIWPLYDRDGQITGRVYVSHDITAMKELENELRGLNQALEKRVDARTKELAEAYDTTLEGWARALELRDKETEGHSRRVTETTLKVARAVGVPEEQLVHIRRGAILHDIGKMSIPDDILRKRGGLTDEERAIIEQHPDTAHQLLERIPFLGKAMDIPYCHHEKWDGAGYPRGLKGKKIPLAARIFTVVDVWDAIQSERPYKEGWSRASAIEHLKEQSGKYFDPEIVDVFLRMIKEGRI